MTWGCVHQTTSSIEPGKNDYLVQPFYDRHKKSSGIFIVDLSSGASIAHETEFDVHHVVYDYNLKQFVGANKYGKQFLTFKSFDMGDLKYFNLKDSDFSLSGHVLSSSTHERDYYFFTAVNDISGHNAIVKVEKESHKVSIFKEFEKTSPPVHDMKLMPNTDIIVATAGKNLHFFDLSKPGHHEIRLISTSFEVSCIRHFEVFQDTFAIQSNIITKDFSYSAAELIIHSKNKSVNKLISRYYNDLKDNEIHDLAISRDLKYVAIAHGGAYCLTFFDLDSGAFSRIDLTERVYRVCQQPGQKDFLAVGGSNIYRIDMVKMKAIPLALSCNVMSENYYYSHRTLVQI